MHVSSLHTRRPLTQDTGTHSSRPALSHAYDGNRRLNTGDIGCFDDGGYLYINSRARDMILRNAESP